MAEGELFFESLRNHRKSRKIEISEICEYTKISPRYIEAIESGEFSLLPTVYMRLFLRSYAEYIGENSQKALEDFELYTTGRVASTNQHSNQTNKTLKEMSESNTSQKPFTSLYNSFSRKELFKAVIVITSLLALLFWAGKITQEQGSDYQHITPRESTSDSIKTNSKQNRILDKIAVIEKLDATPLNSNDFLEKNKIKEFQKIVELSDPYSIEILILNDTKISLSSVQSGTLVELANQLYKKGQTIKFNFESKIFFDLWSGEHINFLLNREPISAYLNNYKDATIRGSYEVKSSQLYLSFFKKEK